MAKVIDERTDKQIHDGRREKLRATFQKYGLETFNETQVLEFALGMTVPRIDTNPTAHRLIEVFGSLDGVISASPDKLVKVPGVGQQSANFLHFLKQFTTYINGIERTEQKIMSPSDAVELLRTLMQTYPVEHFIMVCLDKNGKILTHDTIRGDLEKVDINLRQITDIALRVNTAAVVFAHNHLNGKTNPSDADMNLTRNLVGILLPIGINVIDHIIFADSRHFSFFASGILDIFKREHKAFVASQDYKDIVRLGAHQ